MKKTISLFLTVVMLFAVVTLCLTGCALFKTISVDEAKTNLENAGYEVTVMSGEEYVQKEDAFPTILSSDLNTYLYAVKGEDVIHLFFFISTDVASENADFIYASGLTSGQSNSVVYLSTKQARKDAGV